MKYYVGMFLKYRRLIWKLLPVEKKKKNPKNIMPFVKTHTCMHAHTHRKECEKGT